MKNNDARVFIIAEAGVNHNGNVQLAKQLIDVAANAGADAVKFQTWKTELLVADYVDMAAYQQQNTGKKYSQFEMLKALELSYAEFEDLKQYCDDKNIMFLSTPDEYQSALFLNRLQQLFKIGSGELTNIPFLRQMAQFNKPIILSTGMGTLGEVEAALNVIEKAGVSRSDITLLHATTAYPTTMANVNLKAMQTLHDAFPGVKTGYSDHTLGIEVAVAAVAMGATVIEKHFTLDRTMTGPDHQASLEAEQLKCLVTSIRNIEKALGNGIKAPCLDEIGNQQAVRKSIVASKAIRKGEMLTEQNLMTQRAGGGVSAILWDSLIGTYSGKNYRAGELI